MAINAETLKKYLKHTKLEIISLEDVSIENMRIICLNLRESVAAESSSLQNGKPITVTSNKIYVADANYKRFLEEPIEVNDYLL